MNTNTKEYEMSILKKIDESITKTTEKLAPIATIKNEDKTPEELFEEMNLKSRNGALKLIKSELIRENEKNHTNLEYKMIENEEVKVLIKLANNHKETMEGYLKSGNTKLYDNESAELKVIEEFTPAQPTEEDIVNFTKEVIAAYIATKEEGYTPSMRDMGQIVPKVKAKYPNVDGNIIRKTLLG